jgi:16S rRNA (cytidine1402-2'-O)-methyltransferase
METPFRNGKMLEDILSVCRPATRLCIAADITLESEEIVTRTVAGWRDSIPGLDRRPAVYLLLS